MDEEIIETTEETPENIPAEAPAPEEPAPEAPPEPAEEIPEPEPDPDPPPVVEVISVDDLLDRLTPEPQEPEPEPGPLPEPEPDQQPEEDNQGTEEATGGELPDFFDGATVITDDAPLEVVGMDELLKRLKTLQETAEHPIMTTPFDDYTVTEGLLLLVFVLLLLDFFLNLLRRWF